MVASSLVIATITCAFSADKSETMKITLNSLSSDYWDVLRAADVAVVASAIPRPDDAPDITSNDTFFQLKEIESIKGVLPQNGRVIIYTGRTSTEGSPPDIEKGYRYLFFLKKETTSPDARFIYFSVVINLQGVVALDKRAKDQRAVNWISRNYDFDVLKNPGQFVSALKFATEGSVFGQRALRRYPRPQP